MTTLTPTRPTGLLFDKAPRWLGISTFIAGTLSLISAAAPGLAVQIPGVLGAVLSEAPNFAEAFVGIAMLALSLGLMRRVRMAYLLTLLAVVHGVIASTLLKPNWLEALLYVVLFSLLVASRHAFFRRSRLLSLRFKPIWFALSGLALLVAAFAGLLWISHESGYISANWWDLAIHPQFGTSGRPLIFAGALVGLIAFIALVSTSDRPIVQFPDEADFERINEAQHAADQARPDSMLAYVGDKQFLYLDDGPGYVMYARSGDTYIAMGAPTGPRGQWGALLSAFKAAARKDGATPAIYSAPPELLPDLIETGFKVEKIGENAILDLETFSLSGRKREVIRRGRRKLAERQGATFTVYLPPHTPERLALLKPVSDAWLAANGGSEKSFSLGRFKPSFLDVCPIGVVEIGSEPVAFGSLMVTVDKGWAGIDLMRFDPGKAVTNTMDFLFVELILWAKEQGYRKFDLAMAPLSGIGEADDAPLFAKLGRLIFDHGERLYNFQGLRRFKQKFDPEWEPRFLAAPGAWSLPVVLAKVAILTNGGPVKGAGRRSEKKVQSPGSDAPIDDTA